MDRYRRLVPFVHNDLVRAYFILRVEVLVNTMRGRFDEALLGQQRAIEFAKSGGRTAMIAGFAQHEAFVTWLAGDDAALEAHIDEMRRTGATLGSVDYAEIAKAWDSRRPGWSCRPPPTSARVFVLDVGCPGDRGRTAAEAVGGGL